MIFSQTLLATLTFALMPVVTDPLVQKPAEIDFGVVEQGPEVMRTIEVAGSPERRLHAKAARISCGSCRVRLLEPYDIEPGGHFRVEVVLGTVSQRGLIERIVHVETDDPAEPVRLAIVTATVTPTLVTDPQDLVLEDLVRGQAKHWRFELTGGFIKKFKVESIACSLPGVTCETIARDERDGSPRYEVRVDFPAMLSGGPLNARLEVSLADHEPVVLPLMGQVAEPVSVEPASIAFGVVALGQEASETIVLKRLGGPDFAVISIEASDERLTAEPRNRAAAGQHEIRVAFKAGGDPGRVAAKITIHTDHPDGETLLVPVYAYVPSGKP